MNRLQMIPIFVGALLFLAGCAVAPPAERAGETKIVVATPSALPGEKPDARPPLTEDHDLFTEGLVLLNAPDRSERALARAAFVSLIERYPQSRWRVAAEAFIGLIDAVAASAEAGRREELLTEQLLAERTRTEQIWAELGGVMKENESLKTKLRELTEQLQKETMSLTQENEKLKRDLRRLKDLEIELEKRERMLR
jgi:hypothetical protein